MSTESIVLSPEANTTEQAAHDAAMVAKVDASLAATEEAAKPKPPVAEANAANEGERPEWLPEKFKSPEDLAKAYAELEKKQGEKKTEEKPPVEETAEEKTAREAAEAEALKNAPVKPDSTNEEAEAALKNVGLDYNKFSQEVITNGELSEASYEELAKAGIPKEIVDGYIQGQVAISEKSIAAVQTVVGGEAEYNDMIKWAGENLTKAEQAEFDKQVTTTNVEQAKLAVTGLHARYKAAVGEEPNLLKGGNKVESGDSYESNKQVTADMSSDLYKKDPAERERVKAKIARSPKVL